MLIDIDMASDPVALGPDEVVPGRPFTAVDWLARDVSLLYEILGDIHSILAEVDAGSRSLRPYQKSLWKVDGLTHSVLICDEHRLRRHQRPCLVGFFGERHIHLDQTPLDEANTAIVGEFSKYPGILSYSSMELPDGHWANLVLHDDPVDREYWRKSKLHAEAVRVLSPVHYRNVRIHNGELVGDLFGSPEIRILRTKYYDYSGETEWRAEREFVTA